MYRILLVDDEILIRDAIRENIDWASMECELAADFENGRQAWAYIRENPVDIVLTDIFMPYMDGLELSRLIHENYPDTAVVIFSGFGEFEYAQKAMKYGVSDYMLKPVTSAELRQVIGKMKTLVDHRRQEKAEKELLGKARDEYVRNAAVIRSKALVSLVNRTQDISESLQALERLGIAIPEGGFRVAVFDMDVYSELYDVDTEKLQESALMAFVLYNISDEIVSGQNLGIAYQEGDSRVCVLFTLPEGAESDEKIREACSAIREMVSDTIGIVTSAGIGGWVRSPEDLCISRGQALELLKRRYLLGEGLMLDHGMCELNREAGLEEELEALKEAVCSGNEEKADKILDTVGRKIKDTLSDRNTAFVFLQQIIFQVNNAWESLGMDRESVREAGVGTIRACAHERSFGQSVEIVRKYAGRVCQYAKEMNISGTRRQAMMAIDYIRANYMNPSLSLNDVCSHLNISVSYFSSLYKDLTGETFTETLGRIRMEKARELLANTNLRNYEIAEKVGFSDPHYFGIAFKKAVGMSPMEYAKEKRR